MIDWAPLIGSLSGGIIGFAGQLITKLVAMKEEKQKHAFKMTEMEFTSKLEVQKADLLLRQTTEEKSAEAFKSAVDAQGALQGSSPFVKDFLSLFRPGLTLLFFLLTFILFWFVDADSQQYIIISFVSLGSAAGGFWFGRREEVKLNSIRIAKKTP